MDQGQCQYMEPIFASFQSCYGSIVHSSTRLQIFLPALLQAEPQVVIEDEEEEGALTEFKRVGIVCTVVAHKAKLARRQWHGTITCISSSPLLEQCNVPSFSLTSYPGLERIFHLPFSVSRVKL